MPLDYKPNSSRSLRNSISTTLKKYLQKVVLLLMNSIEESMKQLTHLEQQLLLWDEYLTAHAASWSVDIASLDISIGIEPSPLDASDEESGSDFDSNLSDEMDSSLVNDFEGYDEMFGAQLEGEAMSALPTGEGYEAGTLKYRSLAGAAKLRSWSSPPRMSKQANLFDMDNDMSFDDFFPDTDNKYDLNYPPLSEHQSFLSPFHSKSAPVLGSEEGEVERALMSEGSPRGYYHEKILEYPSRDLVTSRKPTFSRSDPGSSKLMNGLSAEDDVTPVRLPSDPSVEHQSQFPITDVAPTAIPPPSSPTGLPPGLGSHLGHFRRHSISVVPSSAMNSENYDVQLGFGGAWSLNKHRHSFSGTPTPFYDSSSFVWSSTALSHDANPMNVSESMAGLSIGRPSTPAVRRQSFNTAIGAPLHEKITKSVSIFNIPSPLSSPFPVRASEKQTVLHTQQQQFSPIVGTPSSMLKQQNESLFSVPNQPLPQLQQTPKTQKHDFPASPYTSPNAALVPPLEINSLQYPRDFDYQSISQIWNDSEHPSLDSPHSLWPWRTRDSFLSEKSRSSSL